MSISPDPFARLEPEDNLPQQLAAQNILLQQEMAGRKVLEKSLRECETHFRQLFEKTKSVLAETQALYQVSRSVITVENLPDLLQMMVEAVVVALSANRVSLVIFDDLEPKQIGHFVKGGPGGAQVIHPQFDDLWSGLSGWVLSEMKPALSPKGSPDPRESPEAQRYRAEMNCGSMIIVPLCYRGKILGTLTAINGSEERDFTQREVELMLAIASQAVVALVNARLDHELHNANTRLEQRVEAHAADLAQANRMLNLRSECNQILVRAVEERPLLKEICRILVELGGYPWVWVGFANQEDVRTIRMVNQAGSEEINLDPFVIPCADRQPGECPTADAICAGRPSIARNIQTNPAFESLREPAVRLGCNALMALPLQDSDRVFGVLNIYATHANAFLPDEVNLLLELAGDLAYGLTSLRAQAARIQAEQALRESEAMYRTIFENSGTALAFVEDDTTLSLVNKEFERLSGYAKGEIEGKMSFGEFVAQNDEREQITEYQRQHRSEPEAVPWSYEFLLVDRAGHRKDVLATVSMMPGTRRSLAALLDTSERKWSAKVREALYAISQTAISVDRLEDLYSSIHHILGELMPAENFFIALYSPSSDVLSFPYFVDQVDSPPAPRKSGRGLTEYVLRTGCPIIATPQVFVELIQRGEVESEGASSVDWLGVPLKVESQIIGVMAVQSYLESVRFGKMEMSILEFVSAQVAMAIVRKRSEEGLRRRLDELTVLHAVASASVDATTQDKLIERTTQILGNMLYPDNFGVMLLDDAANRLFYHPSYRGLEPNQVLFTTPIGKGITGWVALTGRSWRVSDFSHEPDYLVTNPQICSELCVPLKAGDRVIGVINTESTRYDAFSEADERLLETIAGQLATAIEKLRLFEETRRHLQSINALHTIDLALTSSFDLHLTLNVLLEQLLNHLAVDAADVLLLDPHTQTLDYAAGRGFNTNAMQYSGQHLSDSRAGRVVLERNLVYIPNLMERNEEYPYSMPMGGENFVAYCAAPLISKGQVKGVLEVYHRAAFSPDQEWLDFLGTLATQAAIAVDNSSLFDELQRSNQELTIAYDATLEGWSRALELRDQETEGHSRRVTNLTMRLAKSLRVTDSEMLNVRRGALLHDIGKMGIPDKILLKPDSLIEDEKDVMHKHPTYALEMLYPISYLRSALDIPYRHHEKWDGTGYPRGLKGEQIPLAARIFAIVDVWDALNSDRPYRKAWKKEVALEYIRAQSGSHFDPQIVDVFLKLVTEA